MVEITGNPKKEISSLLTGTCFFSFVYVHARAYVCTCVCVIDSKLCTSLLIFTLGLTAVGVEGKGDLEVIRNISNLVRLPGVSLVATAKTCALARHLFDASTH